MKFATFLLLSFAFSAAGLGLHGEDGFIPLFDGETFTGWKASTENPGSFVIEDGAIVTRGPRAHLFYTGDLAPLKNFELKVDVWVDHNSNGGIYFHTKYQESGWPTGGFECQVNVSHKDWKKTGSIYDVANLGLTPLKEKTWWTQHIIVEGKTITVRINDVVVLQYKEPEGAVPGERFERVLGEGTIGLQCHDPDSVIRYRNIRVKVLTDSE
ncbi:MAG: DUF1080 domain-containing protein [Puniceicoccaceae bacterium]